MGLLGALFGGGSKTDSNQAYPALKTALMPGISAGVGGIANLGGQLDSFDDYKKNAGFDNALNYGANAITGNEAAAGMLRSGSTKSALARMIAGLSGQFYDNYLNHVDSLGQLGVGAAGVLSNAGQQSKSTDYGKGILGTLFSDRRLKTDIIEVGKHPASGLKLYAYRFNDIPGMRFVGMMADEVAEKYPDAVGSAVWPVDGKRYMTVDYEKVAHHG